MTLDVGRSLFWHGSGGACGVGLDGICFWLSVTVFLDTFEGEVREGR